MIRPATMLIAEDHTGWDGVTKLPAQGGLGFDATWDVGFYHSLIGDADMAGDRPRLLKRAGAGWNEPLPMDALSGALYASQHNRVVFHESHDEAGNAGGTARTLVVAVNDAPLVGATRAWAEARSRVCCGLSLLSAGTPMFFMGEEIGARKRYTYDGFLQAREDILGERTGNGQALFRFYQDLITLTRRFRSTRSQNIDILHQSNSNRIVAFKRWHGDEEIIVVASLNDVAFADGYVIEKDVVGIPDAGWKEILNSDSASYGGRNVGNRGAVVASAGGRLGVVVPAAAVVVFVRQ
jgi:1,4-alpha-glucan branching enzyme